ncbi:MAG TPA: hypothetical protein VK699_13675 [Terriglobales bacterium]|nr:hypothetical protein [Terriglobales bacterium]
MKVVFNQDPKETHFLNVDVDVWSKFPLDQLIVALGDEVFVHYVGLEGERYGAHFSLSHSFQKDADTLTRRLATLITNLPRTARKLWNNAQVRQFNIGMQSGVKPPSHKICIKKQTLEAVVRVGGSIVVTTYAAQVKSYKRRSRNL